MSERPKIGLLDPEPTRLRDIPEGLTPQQQTLRKAVINRFASKKTETYILDQIKHINNKAHVADAIRFLFDDKGLPHRNTPLEDIVAARRGIETEIRLLEAVCSALREHLSNLREIEGLAFETLEKQLGP